METEKIKEIIENIVNDGSGIICTDRGSGSGGPGYADSEELRRMLDAGAFEDARVVDFDESLARDSFAGQCEYDEDTEWIQIEFNDGDLWCQIAWIWE